MATQSLYQWYRGFIQGKTRIMAAWVFVFLMFFVARDWPNLIGTGIIFAGATIRYWASGYLRKDNRPAIGGPYQFVRNPLYVGTYLMAAGALAAVGQQLLVVVFTALYFGIYHYIVLDEETKLEKIFGEPYVLYCANVPRFFPRPVPPSLEIKLQINPEPGHRIFDRELAAKNRAMEAYWSFLGILAFLCLSVWAHRSGLLPAWL